MTINMTSGLFNMDNIKVTDINIKIKSKEDIINYLKSTDRIDYNALINIFKANDKNYFKQKRNYIFVKNYK